jgi:hypothetical protein
MARAALSRIEGRKKEPPFPAAFEVDNREASNRVTGATRLSKVGHSSHNPESLTDRKRTIIFSLRLPFGFAGTGPLEKCIRT